MEDLLQPEAIGFLGAQEILFGQAVNDKTARDLVIDTFERFRSYRYRNHDTRWNTNDALFFGWTPQRFWEGTRVPRANYGSQIVFDQVEAALPIISDSLFGNSDWLEVAPLPGATIEQARQQKERLLYILECPRDKIGTTARQEFDLAAKQVLLYGNGYVSADYDVAAGMPTVNWLDTRDLYLDPGCKTPIVDDCGATVKRSFLTVDQLEAMRGGAIKLPSKEGLAYLAQQRPSDTSDITKQNQEAFRGVWWRPGADDDTEWIARKGVEILCYESPARIIWILNRAWVAYNQPNPYGFFHATGAPCFIVPGRHYAMGYGDVLEYDQKYIQAIANGRLDELSLALDPPRGRKRGAVVPAQMNRLRPGLIMEFENPKDDVVFFPPTNTTQNGWQEIQYLQQQAQSRTGVTGIITNGTPLRSNASRTATGVQAQTGGPTSRIQRIVQMIEDYLIVPTLYKLVALDQFHSKGTLKGFSPGGAISEVPAGAMGAPVRFKIKGASRMLSQQKLMQMVPFLAQYIMNGPFMSQLAKSGQTVDFGEFSKMMQDASGTREAYQLFRPLSDQEKQAMSAPPPEAQMKMQLAQMSNQTQLQRAQMKLQGDILGHQQKGDIAEEQAAIQLLKLLQTAEQAPQRLVQQALPPGDF